MEKTIVLPESFLPFSEHSIGGIRLHEFQVKIMNVLSQKDDCLLIQAPTGSGKTFSFTLPLMGDFSGRVDDPKELIITPTNALAHQIKDDISNGLEGSNKKPKVSVWTARTLGSSWWNRTEEIVRSLESSDVIVSNPDIISLFVAGFYLLPGDRAKQWTRLFRRISVVFIDEYHSYPEEEVAKVLSFIILAKATGNSHVRYVFTSATPNSKIADLLTDLGITYSQFAEVPYPIGSSPDMRKFRGEVSVTFTDEKLMDSLNDVLKKIPDGRMLFLADHVADAEMMIDRIMKALPGEPVWELTGIETRNPNRRKPTGKERFILATNAAELGLNMDVDVAHIEPGMHLENFKQRFGRVARGKSGELAVHVDSEIIKQIPDGISTDADLFTVLEQSLPGKDFYITAVKKVMSAYLYLVYKKSRQGVPEQVESMENKGPLFNVFKEFDRLANKMKALGKNIFDEETLQQWDKWWYGYLRAFSFFRGQSTDVPVALPRRDRKETTFDIIWLLRNTCSEIMETPGNKKGKYNILEYLPTPEEVILHYNFLTRFTVKWQGGGTAFVKDVKSKLVGQFNAFLNDYRVDINMSRNRELIESIEKMKNLFPKVVEPIYPTLLPPDEVKKVVDEIFI